MPAEFALVADAEDTDQVPGRKKSVECDVAGVTERDHKLAQVVLEGPPNQWVVCKHGHRAMNAAQRVERGNLALFGKEPKARFEVVEGAARIDYLRHGFGRRVGLPRAMSSSQACTSLAA